MMVLFLLAAWCFVAPANPVWGFPDDGLSSREAREDATRALPVQQLPPQAQARVWEIVSKPSIYRRMPAKSIECDPDLYLFLLQHPEVVVNIWDLMGITQVQIERIGPNSVKAADGAGTQCVAHTLLRTRDIHVIYAEGFYEGPLLKNRVHGSCVLLLRSAYTPSPAGDTVITSHLDVFVKVDNVGVDLLARTLNPLVGKSADANFTESAAFLGKISQAASENGPGVQRLAEKLEHVEPPVRHRFSELVMAVGNRAALRSVDTYEMEQPASEVVQRAAVEGVTPFGQAVEEDPFPPTPPGSLEPPRRGMTLRR
jgi:hypothetical protein